MPDREKIISHLNDCMEESKLDDTWVFVRKDIVEDTIGLLKEQEPEWEHLWDAPDGTFKGRCKKCGYVHFFIEGHDKQYKFCPQCGRSVK